MTDAPILAPLGAAQLPSTLQEGYTLAQMIQRVRQVLRPSSNTMDSPSEGPQGYTLQDLQARVRNVLRDDNKSFVTDAEITTWLNEGMVDVALRTRTVRLEISGSTDASANITLPANFVESLRLEIDSQPADLVNSDEQWYDWVDGGQTPPRTIFRIFHGKIETYPITGIRAYRLRYAAKPTDMLNLTDQSEVPVAYQLKALQYARSHAKLKMNELLASEQYMSLYEHGLGPLTEGARPGEEIVHERTPQPLVTTITDYEITDLLNEAILDLAVRTRAIMRSGSGTTDGTAYIGLPQDFAKYEWFVINTGSTQPALPSPASDVQFVDNSTFQSWKTPGSVPPKTIGRYVGSQLELYPAPQQGLAYTFEYIGRPTVLKSGGDKCEIPTELQNRAIRYAQAHCKLKEGDGNSFQAYMAMFTDHLPPIDVVQRKIPGPNQMIPMPGPFDVLEARHL